MLYFLNLIGMTMLAPASRFKVTGLELGLFGAEKENLCSLLMLPTRCRLERVGLAAGDSPTNREGILVLSSDKCFFIDVGLPGNDCCLG